MGKHTGTKPQRRLRHKWEENNRMDLEEMMRKVG